MGGEYLRMGLIWTDRHSHLISGSGELLYELLVLMALLSLYFPDTLLPVQFQLCLGLLD